MGWRLVLFLSLLAVFHLLSGCTTTKADSCYQFVDPAAPPGFTLYACPHPFPVPDLELAPGSFRWAYGVTNCRDHTIFIWDRFSEVLAHEYRHARLCDAGGGQH